ncbi:response regulator transcription factor [Chryseobacterium ginsenosidimutans]|uniref:helix-turn-helix domain-containing protein n=1 Tax=Chryseobacterium ginsenosidimutans TaxID=687846 RepID=UPI0031E2CF32
MDTHHIRNEINEQLPAFKAAFYQFSDEPSQADYSRRDFYKIWLVNHSGTLTFPERSVRISGPSLLFLHPLLPYAFMPDEKERSGYWAIFTEAFLRTDARAERFSLHSLFRMESPSILTLQDEGYATVSFLFQHIVSTYHSGYTLKYESLKSFIDLLMHEGLKMQPAEINGTKQNAASRIAGQFLDTLERQYPIATPMEPIVLRKPKDFAAVLAIHVNHLNAVVQEVTGKSTRTHIAERMIAESKALLHFSNWSIADIAYCLGFEYPNHFNNFFKKHTGATPLSLRR